MNWNFDKLPEPDGMPDFLRRDANNRAPFMKHPDQTSPMTVGPEAFAEPDLCEDEGCPNFGTPHVCISRATGPQETTQAWLPPWGSTS